MDNALYIALPFTPEAATRIDLLTQEGSTVLTMGTTLWVDTGHETARVTNQVIHPQLTPIDDSSDEYVDLMCWLDEWEDQNPEETSCMWALMYNQAENKMFFQAFPMDASASGDPGF